MTDQLAAPDLRFDVPLYTVAEAARALDVPASTFSSWAKGYTRRSENGKPVVVPPILTVLDGNRRAPTIPFIGLAEGMVLAALRRAHVPLQRIRPALDALAKEIGIAHALASKRLYSDGAELLYHFTEHASGEAADAARDLVVVRSNQRVFGDVIADYLQRIEYASDGYAKLIRLPGYKRAEVVADPLRSFGQPIFARGGARVADVLERFWTGEGIDDLTAEFGVPASEIEDLLRATSRRAA
jgi:uncharacterized protein (DUF433 family)